MLGVVVPDELLAPDPYADIVFGCLGAVGPAQRGLIRSDLDTEWAALSIVICLARSAPIPSAGRKY